MPTPLSWAGGRLCCKTTLNPPSVNDPVHWGWGICGCTEGTKAAAEHFTDQAWEGGRGLGRVSRAAGVADSSVSVLTHWLPLGSQLVNGFPTPLLCVSHFPHT